MGITGANLFFCLKASLYPSTLVGQFALVHLAGGNPALQDQADFANRRYSPVDSRNLIGSVA